MKYIDLDRQCGDKQFDEYDVIGDVRVARDDMAVKRHDARIPGRVRGGSVGAIIENDTFGICHRKAYLRYNGIETPLNPEIELMTTQGEQNEEIWLAELRHKYAGSDIEVRDQNEFVCEWDTGIKGPDGKNVMGGGSPDVTLWKAGKPVMGLELKNLSSVSTVKGAHYELKPKTDHIIQAANYSIRLGNQFNDGVPVPYKLIYSSRSIWHFFNMSDKNKKTILEKGWDVNWMFGKPMSLTPFHREYLLKWNKDETLSYWTHGLKSWVDTKLTSESIDTYYAVVIQKMEQNNTLGPKPSTKHIDGSSSYSPCNYCDFKTVCAIGDRLTPDEFLDHSKKLAQDLWDARLKK